MIKRIFSLSLILMLAACGLSPLQKQNISQFARATVTISNSTQNQFITIRDTILEIEKRRLIMRNIVPPKRLDLDGGLSITGLSIQLSALQALASYAEILLTLSTHSDLSNIENAASKFISSYERVNSNSGKTSGVNKVDKNALISIAGMSGNWFVEAEKKKHLIRIINNYTPVITSLALVLKHDLVLKENSLCWDAKARKRTSRIKTGVLDHYCTSAKSLKHLSSSKLSVKGLTFAQRKYAYESYVLALSALEEIKLLSQNGEKTISTLINASDSLTNIINLEDFTKNGVKDFVKQVNELTLLMNVLTRKR